MISSSADFFSQNMFSLENFHVCCTCRNNSVSRKKYTQLGACAFVSAKFYKIVADVEIANMEKRNITYSKIKVFQVCITRE